MILTSSTFGKVADAAMNLKFGSCGLFTFDVLQDKTI